MSICLNLPQQADSAALARELVAQCARANEGEIVEISGSACDSRLMQAIAVEVAKVGADPLIILAVRRGCIIDTYAENPMSVDDIRQASAPATEQWYSDLHRASLLRA